MSTLTMSNKASRVSPGRVRTVSRLLHLLGAVALGAFVYGPPVFTAAAQPWMQLLVVPLLGLSGVVLWQQAKLRRLVRRISTR
jgi:hypothetical protein